MAMATASKSTRAIRRLKRLWTELDYAQRRSFELRTGVSAGTNERRRISRSVDELERLYAA